MNYIQYMKEPFKPIGFTVGVPTDRQASAGVQKIRLAGITSDKTPTKEELIQQREEQARSQAKKENNIITETDRQNAEIDANIENATTPRWQKGLKLAKNAANFGLGAGAFVGTTMAYPYFAAAGPGGLAAVGGLQGTALGMMGNALEDQYGFNAGLTTGSAIKDAMLGATGEAVLGPMIGKGISWVGTEVAPNLYNQGKNLVEKLTSKLTTNKNSLFKIAPEYEKFILDHPHLNPNSQEAIDQFLQIQGKSTRGVSGKENIEEALTQIGNKEAKRDGYDIQSTNGGLYTSNSPYIAKQFSIMRNSSADDGIISATGDLQYRFNVDRTLPIIEQLKQYKNSIAFLSDKHGSDFSAFGLRDLVQKLGKKNAVAYEAPYGVNRSNIPTHERVYIKGENPQLSNIEQKVGLSGDMRQRGAGAPDVKVSGEYFYPYELGNLPIDITTKVLNGIHKTILPITYGIGTAGLAGMVPYVIEKPEYSWFQFFTPKDETQKDKQSSDFKSGGSIHIKKKNKGKFTASAKAAGEGVQEHAHKVMNDPNATPLQKKRANFAIQAKKWHHKHQLGGKINYLDIFA